jgi:hypothetical protein
MIYNFPLLQENCDRLTARERAIDPWALPSLYLYIRNQACIAHPGNYDAAFRHLCATARSFVFSARWPTEPRSKDDVESLTMLAILDVDAYLALPAPPSIAEPEPVVA